MPLSAESQQIITMIAAYQAPEARNAFFTTTLSAKVPHLHKVENRMVPGPAGMIPIRIYTPVKSATPLPLVVFFHGGAYVSGDLDSHDVTIYLLASETGYIFVSVQYRLAPNDKYPAAVQDTYAATVWAYANAASLGADPDQLVLMGDSVGGGLAAATALMARDKGTPPVAFQVPIYPAVAHQATYDDYKSWKAYGNGYFLTREMMEGSMSLYLPEPATKFLNDPYVTPLKATRFEGLAPALIITGEYDPLRDEGEAYAALLKQNGVPVLLTRYDGAIHGFMSFPMAVADEARKRISRVLRTFFMEDDILLL